MRRLIVAAVNLSLFLMFAAVSLASSEARKFLEYGTAEANCETEMAHLDNYAITIQNAPEMKAYVVVYGGRQGTARSELQARRARIKRYLINERAIEPARVFVVDGGFRESLTIELWLLPIGAELPKAKPTVSPREVKYKRAKYRFDCSTFY
ncbi:MAG: hypothetical protein H0U54_10625 [Acidobacteria bacterium]|nr:hypothetical protein [Acidobacteriota bacterium]